MSFRFHSLYLSMIFLKECRISLLFLCIACIDLKLQINSHIASSIDHDHLRYIRDILHACRMVMVFVHVCLFCWVHRNFGGSYCRILILKFCRLAVVFLAFDVFFAIFCVVLACLIGIALCCCLPCIIAILYAVAGQV